MKNTEPYFHNTMMEEVVFTPAQGVGRPITYFVSICFPLTITRNCVGFIKIKKLTFYVIKFLQKAQNFYSYCLAPCPYFKFVNEVPVKSLIENCFQMFGRIKHKIKAPLLDVEKRKVSKYDNKKELGSKFLG